MMIVQSDNLFRLISLTRSSYILFYFCFYDHFSSGKGDEVAVRTCMMPSVLLNHVNRLCSCVQSHGQLDECLLNLDSRTSMPILPLPPEIVPKASRFRSQGPLINGRFLVQEASQGKLESGSASRTSNCSRTLQRDNWSRFSTNVVLALPETSSRTERELPLKKRKYYRLKVEKKDERKKEKAADKKNGVKKQVNADVTEVNIDAAKMPKKEDYSEIKGGQLSKSVHCVLNCESFIPCPVIDGLKEQEKAEELLPGATPIKHEEVEKRRGRPKKQPGRLPRENPGVKKSMCLGLTFVAITLQKHA